MIKVAKKFNIVDKPDNKLKIHEKTTPYLGGLAILISFSFFVLDNMYLIIFSFIISLLGLIDDLKNISAIYRFVFEFIITYLTSFFILGNTNIILNLFLAFIGVSIINSFNMIDGMDGLSTGLAMISLMFFYYFLGNQSIIFIIIAILGFYFYNYPPAKIFLGDSGSYLIGFILYYNLLQMIDNFGYGGFFVSLVILGFFLTDLVWALIRRTMNSGKIFDGDKDHIYDKARTYFDKDKNVLSLMYLVNIVFGLFSVITWNFKYFGVIISLVTFFLIGYLLKLYRKT
jgi:UDP-GlcNAc:undecaprenyl-phosphate GlcNAc-1-phosphate transferase